MHEQAFREWLADRSWGLAVRYCRAVAWLLPPAALAANAPYLLDGSWPDDPGFLWLLTWQVTAEVVCITTVLANEKINVMGVRSRSNVREQTAEIDMELEIYNINAFNRALAKLSQLNDVISAKRL